MTLLAVNFHYVSRERPTGARAIVPVTVDELVAQVDELGRHFELIDRDALEAAVAGARPLPERACLITFDDGLRQQAELALPALLARGVVPLFLVPGQPLAEGRALYVHKVHHLREALGPEELRSLLAGPLARLGLSTDDVAEHEARRAYGYDELAEAQLKFLLNRVLPFEERERVIDEIFSQVVEDEHEFCEGLYMSADMVAELEREYSAVGAHSYAHRPLALLGPEALRDDLVRAAATLERVTGVRPRTISYPHGSLETVDRSVAAAAADVGFTIGFTMERALNRTLVDPLLLARVDTNDAPGGTSPLLAVDGNGSFVTSGRLTSDRTSYAA
jgi:peptidoglycan/xylan/chitin deacetylase (PgdA/CDA1 family)